MATAATKKATGGAKKAAPKIISAPAELPPAHEPPSAAYDTAPPGAQPPKLEIWRHSGAGRVFLTKFNAAGTETSVAVGGGKTVTLTPQERRLNQDRCASDKLDFFKNGTLVPVRLVESEYDFEELANNRQVMSDEEIAALLTGHPSTFKKRVEELTNPVTIQRIIDAAGDEITVAKLGLLTQRLAAVNPDALSVARMAAEGTTGLRDATPDPGLPQPEVADWANFTPTHTFQG